MLVQTSCTLWYNAPFHNSLWYLPIWYRRYYTPITWPLAEKKQGSPGGGHERHSHSSYLKVTTSTLPFAFIFFWISFFRTAPPLYDEIFQKWLWWGWGGWFYTGGIMGEWEVSLHRRQRGASPPPLFYEWRPPYVAYSPFFKYCPTPPPHFPITSNSHCSFCCPVWKIAPHLMCYFT